MAKKRQTRRENGEDESQSFANITNSAVKEGISRIIESNPRFRGREQYILGTIDGKKLNEVANQIYGEVKSQADFDPQQRVSYFHERLADYVAEGGVFDSEGKSVIFRKGLEERAKSGVFSRLFSNRKVKKRIEEEQEIDKNLAPFGRLYSLIQTGGYPEITPEIAGEVIQGYRAELLSPFIEQMVHYGKISQKKGREWHLRLGEIAKRAYGGIENAIDKYVGSVDEQAYAKAAAFVLGFFGILIALSSGTNITGFATGGSEKSMIFISGGLMIIASMVMLSKSFKK